MNSKKQIILKILNLYRIIPSWILLQLLPAHRKIMIFDEMEHWNHIKALNKTSHFNMFSELMVTLPEYRSLLEFRCGSGIIKYIIKILFPPLNSLYIWCDNIGPRLFIQHEIGRAHV